METRFLPQFSTLPHIRDFIESHGNRMCPPANLVLRLLEVRPVRGGWWCSLIDFSNDPIAKMKDALANLPPEVQALCKFNLYIFGSGEQDNHSVHLVPGDLLLVVAVNKMAIIGDFCTGAATADDVFNL